MFPFYQFLEPIKGLKYMYVCHQNWKNELTSGVKPMLRILSKRERVRKGYSLGSNINMKNLKTHGSLSII